MAILDYEVRGGHHPNGKMEIVERAIQERAFNNFINNKHMLGKGLKWVYNWTHFLTLWSTKDKELINLIFELRPYPRYIEVEVTTRCNLKCNMCEHTYWNEVNKDMTFDEFKYIIDQFPDLEWIGLTGIGESFLNKDFMKMLKYVKEKNIYVELYDSFYFMNEDTVRELVELGVDRIFASIDAATKSTYEKIRVGSNWEKVMGNVKALDKWKKKMHTVFPELCFHYIITKDNIHEVTDYLELLNQLKIDVSFVQFARMLHKYPETENLYIDVPKEVQENILKKGEEVGIRVQWNLNLPEDKPYFTECVAWTMPFIFVDGTVIPCCCINEQNDREWQRKNRLGNISEEPFRDIWYGEKYKELIDGIQNDRLPEVCSRCPIFKVNK